MIIRHLSIENFRGIRLLGWHLNGRILCLVGPNDSSKTSILDAIELALFPRPYVQLSDCDFHNSDVDNSIKIEITIGELPNDLLSDDKFGLYLRGYRVGEGIKDDPVDGVDPVLTIRFFVDKELEPTWTVVKEGQDESKIINWRDRERLGLARLGNDIDRHLTWSKGSALSKITEGGATPDKTFLNITRSARQVVADANLELLKEAAQKAGTSAKEMGAYLEVLSPGLDVVSVSLGGAVLGLHESTIPLRMRGLGTRRLVALGIQQAGTGRNSILLIDEIEHGLEPHRIRHLLKQLTKNSDGTERNAGQVIFSTHSPTCVIALPVTDLRFVRSSDVETKVTEVNIAAVNNLQGIARKNAHAFLGRKLLVCEGATEVGFCRGLEKYWAAKNNDIEPSLLGFIGIDGMGRTQAPNVSIELKRIGYEVAIFGDSDEPFQPPSEDLAGHGIPVFQWEDNVCIEAQIVADLPRDLLQELLDAVCAEESKASIFGQISTFVGRDVGGCGQTIAEWIGNGIAENQLRGAVAKTANNRRWFKSISLGTRLGEIVAIALPRMAGSKTEQMCDRLMRWIYG